MSGELKLRTKWSVTGLGDDVNWDTEDVTMTVPVEHSGSPLYIIHSTAGTTAMQLSTLFPQYDVGAIYGVYIECASGTIYIMLNTAGTTTFDETTADLEINEGEGFYIPVNPDLTSANGMTIDAASVTDAFLISVFVKSEA